MCDIISLINIKKKERIYVSIQTNIYYIMNNKKIIFRDAEVDDVDFILDMKLDIILNNEKVLNMNKNELERQVLEAEEQIRENLNEYKMILANLEEIGFISIIDLDNEIVIDNIYIINEFRNNGVGTYILKEIIRTNFKPIFIDIDKNYSNLINICQNIGFVLEEETENKLYMKYQNEKEENKQIKAEILCKEVSKLCEKYNIEYFFYTDNKSICNINSREVLNNLHQYINKKI